MPPNQTNKAAMFMNRDAAARDELFELLTHRHHDISAASQIEYPACRSRFGHID